MAGSEVLVTAPGELRALLRDLPRGDLLATCAANRVKADDDSLAGIIRLTLRELAARIAFVDAQVRSTVVRLRRITEELAPGLVAITEAGTAKQTPPCGASPWSGSAATQPPVPVSTGTKPKTRPRSKRSAASPARSTTHSANDHTAPSFTLRGATEPSEASAMLTALVAGRRSAASSNVAEPGLRSHVRRAHNTIDQKASVARRRRDGIL